MSDIVERLVLLQSGAAWQCSETADTLDEAAAEIKRLRAALAEAQRVPDGWRLVPVEATEAMRQAGGASRSYPSIYMGGPPHEYMRQAERIYRAMLDAAPQPPAQDDGWQPIETAPRDQVVLVYAPPYEGLDAIICTASYDECAGWCVDELRQVTHWRLLPAPPAQEAE